jgi:hypothetical protein
MNNRREFIDDIHLESDELGCDIGVTFATSFRPAIFDCDCPPLDPAEFAQSLDKSCSRPVSETKIPGRDCGGERPRCPGK